ncbi:putative transcriptional regulator [Streptomyces sp. TE12347]
MQTCILEDMADTTMKVDSETRDRFAAVAAAQGKSVRAYLAELAIEEENQLALGRATAAFREVVSKPGIAEAFDAAFGGLPSPANTRRAA